jgi:hypothetical protein
MTLPRLETATVAGLHGSLWARREEANRALAFLAQVEQLAETTKMLEPHGKAMAEAVMDARDAAIESVLLWRCATIELRRAAEAEAGRTRRAG